MISKKILISKSKMISFFGKRAVENCINDHSDWLNAWGANIRHVRGGMWSIYGHHQGEAEETINHLIAI